MKFLVTLLLLIGLTYGSLLFVDPDLDPLSDQMIDAINSVQTTWKAGRNFESNFNIPRTFGVLSEKSDLKVLERNHLINFNLPENFDARQAWPGCSSINLIRDQSGCGACWAFSSVEAMSDRICIASKGQIQVDLSPEDPLNCCRGCGYGCEGGTPEKVYDYYEKFGIVSGGLYNGTGCKPYSIAPGLTDQHVPGCKPTCTQGYNRTIAEDKHFGQSPYKVTGVQQIMTEIMTHGPVTGTFTIYSDWLNYKSGVYQQTSQKKMSRHAIKILGWGIEDNVDYWLVANSMGTSWGDNGFFKIKRGTNECGIESEIVAGLPKL